MAQIILRVAVAFAFLYPAVSAWFLPTAWLGYVPQFMRGDVDDLVLLHAFGAVEIFIALWILSGWKIFWPSLAATAVLLAIVVFNPQEFPVLFRDLSLSGMTLALALMNRPRKQGLAEHA